MNDSTTGHVAKLIIDPSQKASREKSAVAHKAANEAVHEIMLRIPFDYVYQAAEHLKAMAKVIHTQELAGYARALHTVSDAMGIPGDSQPLREVADTYLATYCQKMGLSNPLKEQAVAAAR